VDVRLITENGVERRKPAEIEALLEGPGLLWIDVAHGDAHTEEILGKQLNLHPRAMHDCAVRNPVPKLHVHPDHAFVVLHAPERGARGHVRYIELDQFVGTNWLLTVHGPINPVVPLEAAYVETGSVARKLDGGRLRPNRACELSASVVTALTNRLRDFLTELTQEVWSLERQVTGGHMGDPEVFLEELFGVRHGLLAVRTMAALSREVYGRMCRLSVFGPGARRSWRTCRSSSAGSPHGRQPARVPAGRDRVLPDQDRHQDDHRGGATGRDRRGDAAHHRALVDRGHERHRQRGDARRTVDRAADGHAGHVGHAAAVGSAEGLVVIVPR
jgi:hypothetical protein